MKLLLLLSMLLLALGVACAPASRKTPVPTSTAAAPTEANSSPTAAPAAGSNTGAQAAAVVAGDAAKGKTLFRSTCSSCHGPDAQGLPGLGKDLVTSEFAKSESDAQLIDFIKKGRPSSDPANTTGVDMPPKGGNPAITDADLADIVAFLRTIEK